MCSPEAVAYNYKSQLHVHPDEALTSCVIHANIENGLLVPIRDTPHLPTTILITPKVNINCLAHPNK